MLDQSIQIITSSVRGAFGSYKEGLELYKRVKSEKDHLIVEDVSDYDLYDQPGHVEKAVEKLTSFYKKYL